MDTNWYPIGYYKDRLSTRGPGVFVEAITTFSVTHEELVSRYNYLLQKHRTAQPRNADDGANVAPHSDTQARA